MTEQADAIYAEFVRVALDNIEYLVERTRPALGIEPALSEWREGLSVARSEIRDRLLP